MAKLLDLTDEGKQLESVIENLESSETGLEGESEKILYDALLKNEEDISKKLEGIVFLIKQLDGEAESRKKLAQDLQKAQKAKENRAKSLKGLIKFFLKLKGLTKHAAGNWDVRLQNDPGQAKLVITRPELEAGDQEALAELKPEFVQKKLVLAIDPNDQEALAKLPAEFITSVLELDRAAVRTALEEQGAKTEEELVAESAEKIDFAHIAERGQHVRID
jgi:hypothetical protein